MAPVAPAASPAEHVKVLESPLSSEADKVTAANSLAILASHDRLSAALSGALPVVSSIYQGTPPGGPLELVTRSFLNIMLAQDEGLSQVVRSLVAAVREASARTVALNTLGVINQIIYHPDEKTQDAILTLVPTFAEFLRSGNIELVCSVCGILAGFGEAANPKYRNYVAQSGILPILAAVYQSAEVDSPVEAMSLSALNKLLLYDGDDHERSALTTMTVNLLDTESEAKEISAAGALSVMNLKIYGADDRTHCIVMEKLATIRILLNEGNPQTRIYIAKVLEGFKDANYHHHFELFSRGLVDDLHHHSMDPQAPSVFREGCFLALAKLTKEADFQRKSILFGFLLELWQVYTDIPSICAATPYIATFATSQTASFERVGAVLLRVATTLSTGSSSIKRVALIMLKHLSMADEFTKERVIQLNCIPFAISLLENGKPEDRQVALSALVTFTSTEMGVDVMLQYLNMLIKRDPSSEIEITRILGNMATFATREGRNEMVAAGVLDVLSPVMKSKDPNRKAILAALAIGNLVGPEEMQEFEDEDFPLQMVLDALKATAAGQSYLGSSLEPWLPTMCLMNLSLNDKNKRKITTSGGLDPLIALLKTGEIQTQLFAAKTIWNLTFTEDVVHYAPTIEECLRDLCQRTSDSEVRENCEGAIFRIEQHKKKREQRKDMGTPISPEFRKALHNDGPQGQFSITSSYNGSITSNSGGQIRRKSSRRRGHVMLSYHWADETLVKWIAEQLETAGYRVWVELGEAESTIEKLVTAVRDSIVVITFLSRAYRDAETCRTVAEYASVSKKRILPLKAEDFPLDGWLVRLFGSKIDNNFVTLNMEDWAKQLPALMRSLGEKGRRDSDTPEVPDDNALMAKVDALTRQNNELKNQLRNMRASAMDPTGRVTSLHRNRKEPKMAGGRFSSTRSMGSLRRPGMVSPTFERPKDSISEESAKISLRRPEIKILDSPVLPSRGASMSAVGTASDARRETATRLDPGVNNNVTKRAKRPTSKQPKDVNYYPSGLGMEMEDKNELQEILSNIDDRLDDIQEIISKKYSCCTVM